MHKQKIEEVMESILLPNVVVNDDLELYNEAVKLMQVSDYKNALIIASELVKKFPFNADMLKVLAACYQELEEFKPAVAAYNLAYTIKPLNNLDCLFYSGICYFKMNLMSEAKDAFTNFIESDYKNEILKKRAQLYINKLNKV